MGWPQGRKTKHDAATTKSRVVITRMMKHNGRLVTPADLVVARIFVVKPPSTASATRFVPLIETALNLSSYDGFSRALAATCEHMSVSASSRGLFVCYSSSLSA